MASMDPTLATDGIVSLFVTAISFGLYLASFAHCVRWLLFEDDGWRARKKIHWTLVTTTLLVFFLSTASFSTTVAGITQTPIIVTGTDIPAFLWVVTILDSSNAVYSSILIIIDSVLIHRCWIVFSKNWFIICLPLVVWCSSLVCAIIPICCSISILLNVTDPMATSVTYQNVQTSKAKKALPTFYVCNIVVSIYTTSALVFKLWSAANNNGTSRLYRTSRIVTESGILYTSSSVLYLALLIIAIIIDDSVESFLLLELLDSIVQPVGIFMPGISFNLITIRVGEQRTQRQDTWVDSKDASKILMPSGLLNRPDTLAQSEAGSTDPGQERHERIDEEVMEINGTEFKEILEVDRTPEQERQL